MTDILAGYQLHITTWENDGDSYKTKILSGLTEADVKFYIDIASRFKSDGMRTNRGLYFLGNQYVPTEKLADLIEECLNIHPDITAEIRTHWEEFLADPTDPMEWFNNILGSPDDEYYYDYKNFCRVFEEFEVFYYPQSVANATALFTT